MMTRHSVKTTYFAFLLSDKYRGSIERDNRLIVIVGDLTVITWKDAWGFKTRCGPNVYYNRVLLKVLKSETLIPKGFNNVSKGLNNISIRVLLIV